MDFSIKSQWREVNVIEELTFDAFLTSLFAFQAFWIINICGSANIVLLFWPEFCVLRL